MKCALEALFARGETVSPTKGDCRELRGVVLEIENPRARLSRSESRGHAFSCLGELCWYLSGSNELSFIEYYLPKYRNFAEDGVLFGAYGPRLLRMRGLTNQLESVVALLKRRPSSRQAVVQLFNAEDIVEEHKDVPCTCTLQFLVRNTRLELIATMRSNDVYVGLPHDVFCFTMIQEFLARRLGVELGVYTHIVGSLHLYDCNASDAQEYVNEGWQSTTEYMPSMPCDDPIGQLTGLLAAEKAVRRGEPFDLKTMNLQKYWADLVRLLQLYRFSTKEPNAGEVTRLCSTLDRRYTPYLEKMKVRMSMQSS